MAFIATGTTITWESGFFAELLSITGPSGSRVSVDTTHMSTSTAMTFTPGDLVDWGEVTCEIAYVPSTTPPIKQAASSCVINWADNTASTWTFTAFMTGFEPTGELEGRATASCTLKVSGDVAIA